MVSTGPRLHPTGDYGECVCCCRFRGRLRVERCQTSPHNTKAHEACLGEHNRPDLETALPEERRAEVYQASYGWFDKHGHVMADAAAGCRARRQRRLSNTRRMWRPCGGGRPLLRDQGKCRRIQHHRSSRLNAAIAIVREWPSLQYSCLPPRHLRASAAPGPGRW